jgi:hypothetical protein
MPTGLSVRYRSPGRSKRKSQLKGTTPLSNFLRNLCVTRKDAVEGEPMFEEREARRSKSNSTGPHPAGL